MDKIEGGYWTDASSLDALSTCSDVEDRIYPSLGPLFSPTPSIDSLASLATPVNVTSSNYSQPTVAYVVGDISAPNNEELTQALKTIEVVPIFVAAEEDFDTENLDPVTSIVIFQNFGGPLFETLRKKFKLRIYGPPIIMDLAQTFTSSDKCSFPVTKSGYPVYSKLLKNCKICATGIRTRDELMEIRRKILYLDGVFLEREGPIMTHLVAARCRGNKYRDAVALDKPILKPEWVDFLWSQRNVQKFDLKANMEKFRVRAFYSARIALDGFDPPELSGMIKLIEENEGVYVEATDATATHVVINNDQIEKDTNRKEYSAEKAKVLKAEWFWTSIQIEACADEQQYQFRQFDRDFNEDTLNNSLGTPNSFTSPAGPFSDTDGGTPLSQGPTSGRRKRKRLIREFVSSLAQVEHQKCIMEVDEDTDTDNLVKSPEQSHDNVNDTELAVILKRIEKGLQSAEFKAKMDASTGKALKRLNEFAHLVETEKNYVRILMNIVKIFKEPCELEDQKAGRLLTPLEIKHIFDPILPIYSLHKRTLRDMLHVLENYTEDSLIGHIYVKNADELRKCYEPFIGYFETVKNEIIRCENENPRFMAFLKIAQAKPQCGKEKLVELIIRPVQRLPSTALVLKNLEKNTEKTNPDYEWITKGVEAIDQVNQTVNQKKERAIARVAIFDIYHEIDGCPVELISDNRSLLKKYDVLALHYDTKENCTTNYKNELLTLVVFSDHLQVVKRRSLASNKASTLSMANLRSPAVSRKSIMFTNNREPHKRYKFLEWINFKNVKKIVNVLDSDPRSFALIVREPEEPRERVMQFTLPEDVELEKLQKLSVVEFFAKQAAHAINRVDYEQFITTVDSAQLISSGSTGGFISRGIKKVGRALSLNRTPSKLKRTMSQIINSPFSSRSCHKERDRPRRDPDTDSQSGSENGFTPIRNHLSSISLFGTKRGTGDGQSTPKARKTFFDKDQKKGFPPIEEA